MVRSLFVLAALACSPTVHAQDAAPPTDEELLEAFRGLEAELQVECIEWFTAECERLPTFQRELIDHVLDSLDQPIFDWRPAPTPQTFDPETHAPAQPIARRFVNTSSGTHKKVVERMLRKVPKRKLQEAHEYSWPLGTVVRTAEHLDPERIAQNAVLGLEPRVDLVEAIVTRALDDGKYREVAVAFGHAYSDRVGNAYRELTLYDAWSSGANMEMPDIEVLGIVHTLLDDWKTWVAPVPGSSHNKLYSTVGEIYLPYHRARGLRTALARTYLQADPVLRDNYGPAAGRLHAFWERAASDPDTLAETLPDGESWQEWLEKEGKAVDTDLELWQRAEGAIVEIDDQREIARHNTRTVDDPVGCVDLTAPEPGVCRLGGG